MTIDPAEIADLIEDGIPDAVARVTTPRVHDDEDEDAHFAAWVVSPAFEGSRSSTSTSACTTPSATT